MAPYGETGTKWLQCGDKLRGWLRDMVFLIHSVVPDHLVGKVQTIGILTGGPCYDLRVLSDKRYRYE